MRFELDKVKLWHLAKINIPRPFALSVSKDIPPVRSESCLEFAEGMSKGIKWFDRLTTNGYALTLNVALYKSTDGDTWLITNGYALTLNEGFYYALNARLLPNHLASWPLSSYDSTL